MSEVLTVISTDTPSQACKARVKAVRDKLPRTWREIFFSHYPNWREGALRRLLENVFAMNSANIQVTEVLEGIANGTITKKDKAA